MKLGSRLSRSRLKNSQRCSLFYMSAHLLPVFPKINRFGCYRSTYLITSKKFEISLSRIATHTENTPFLLIWKDSQLSPHVHCTKTQWHYGANIHKFAQFKLRKKTFQLLFTLISSQLSVKQGVIPSFLRWHLLF